MNLSLEEFLISEFLVTSVVHVESFDVAEELSGCFGERNWIEMEFVCVPSRTLCCILKILEVFNVIEVL